MKRTVIAVLALAFLLPTMAIAQRGQVAEGGQQESYDYWKFNREIIRRGQQAIFMCNGLFTGGRSLEQVFEHELAFLSEPIGTPAGGDYEVDWDL